MKLQLERLRQERARWQQKAHQGAVKAAQEGVSAEERESQLKQSAAGQEQQMALLTKAMAIKLKGKIFIQSVRLSYNLSCPIILSYCQSAFCTNCNLSTKCINIGLLEVSESNQQRE